MFPRPQNYANGSYGEMTEEFVAWAALVGYQNAQERETLWTEHYDKEKGDRLCILHFYSDSMSITCKDNSTKWPAQLKPRSVWDCRTAPGSQDKPPRPGLDKGTALQSIVHHALPPCSGSSSTRGTGRAACGSGSGLTTAISTPYEAQQNARKRQKSADCQCREGI